MYFESNTKRNKENENFIYKLPRGPTGKGYGNGLWSNHSFVQLDLFTIVFVILLSFSFYQISSSDNYKYVFLL